MNKKNNVYSQNKEQHFDMYLDISKRLHTWKMSFFSLFVLFSITLLITLYLTTRSVLIPYVIEVDETGNAKAINPAYQTNYVPKKIEEEYFIKELINNTMLITKDNVINGKNYKKNLYYYKESALMKYRNLIKEEDLSELIKKGYTRDIEIMSINRLSETSYQVRWKDKLYTRDGILKNEDKMIGIYTVDNITPKTLEEIKNNPLGIIIRDFSISKED